MILGIIEFAFSILGLAFAAIITLIGVAILGAVVGMVIIFVNELTGKCEKAANKIKNMFDELIR